MYYYTYLTRTVFEISWLTNFNWYFAHLVRFQLLRITGNAISLMIVSEKWNLILNVGAQRLVCIIVAIPQPINYLSWVFHSKNEILKAISEEREDLPGLYCVRYKYLVMIIHCIYWDDSLLDDLEYMIL